MSFANRRTRYGSSSTSGLRRILVYLFVLVLLALGGFAGYLLMDDLEGPVITMTPDTGRIAPGQDIQITAADKNSNIRSIKVSVERNGQRLVVLDRTFTVAQPSQTASFSLKDAGIRDGAFSMEVEAKDTALFGKGNTTSRTWALQLDTQPPRIRMRSTTPSLKRGSITAVAYTLSEEVSQTGIQLANTFFPALARMAVRFTEQKVFPSLGR